MGFKIKEVIINETLNFIYTLSPVIIFIKLYTYNIYKRKSTNLNFPYINIAYNKFKKKIMNFILN